MEIDVRDAELAFQLLDGGDKQLSARDVIGGFSHLKAGARSIDVAICLRKLQQLQKCMDDIHVDKLDESLKDIVCGKHRPRRIATAPAVDNVN